MEAFDRSVAGWRPPKTHRPLGRGPIKNCQNQRCCELDGNWSSFQLAKSTPPQSVIVMLMPLPQGCSGFAAAPVGARHQTTPEAPSGTPRPRSEQVVAPTGRCSPDNSGGAIHEKNGFGLSVQTSKTIFPKKRSSKSKKLAAPKGVPERSPSSVLTGPCDG